MIEFAQRHSPPSARGRRNAGTPTALVAVVAVALFAAALPLAAAQSTSNGGLQSYTQAHAGVQDPPDRLGGPLQVTLTQPNGGAGFWVFPGPRELDPTVFGTPSQPLANWPGPWPLYGVPRDQRATNDAGDAYTTTTQPTPFSDKFASVAGSVDMTLVDATAIDGATTKDTIDFQADFTGPRGQHQYTVTVKQPLAHGFLYPFFGGVATNVLLHGNSGVGTPLMPTEFTYAAFWGVGQIYRDGTLVNDHQLVHVMLTEPVRGDGYALMKEGTVPPPNASPSAMTLHLLVAPYKVTGGDPPVESAPVQTGVMLDTPSGTVEQPFFHIMFQSFNVKASHPEQP